MSINLGFVPKLQTTICTCANPACGEQFFSDDPHAMLCFDCDEHGWIYVGPSYEDPTDLVFNVLECNEIDDCPF